jgi:hypothetical protein
MTEDHYAYRIASWGKVNEVRPDGLRRDVEVCIWKFAL